MKRSLSLLLILFAALAAFSPARAQANAPLVLVLEADGPVMPTMHEYFQRGIRTAEQRGAELLIVQLNTPGGDVAVTQEMVATMRASTIPIVVYVAPRGSWAASAGTIITLAGHAAAMAPESTIGAASPVGAQGEDLPSTMKAKSMEILKAMVRSLAERRGPEAVALAEQTIEEARAVSSSEALAIGLIDFVAVDLYDLLDQLDGFTVQMADGPRTLETTGANAETLPLTFIEQLLMLLTDPNIVFTLLAIGVQALFIEISSPGGWVAGFVGVVCLGLAVYGMGILPVNWFGLLFLITAMVLFIIDIKAPTHGALTAAGVGSFIVGALVLFNSPGTPSFMRVSLPLVVGMSAFIGLGMALIVGLAVRAQRAPARMGGESLPGRTGVATSALHPSGQVQVAGELWSAELAEGEKPIKKGETVEVVRIEGLRVIVKKK